MSGGAAQGEQPVAAQSVRGTSWLSPEVDANPRREGLYVGGRRRGRASRGPRRLLRNRPGPADEADRERDQQVSHPFTP